MPIKLTSTVLTLMFLTFLTAPTIIHLIDDSIDVSIFYSLAEEEEESPEKNKDKEKDVFFLDIDLGESDFACSEDENYIEYRYKTYPKPHLNLISPPPEVSML